MSEDIEYTISSGNVFADLGLSNSEEANAKAELALEITKLITEAGLTQSEAARLLGINQPKVSALLRGQLTGFSMERLFRFIAALGSDVQIVVKPTAKPSDRGHISVQGL